MGQGTAFSMRPQGRIQAWSHHGDARRRLQQQPHFLQRGLAATGEENLGRVETGKQGKVFHGSYTSVSSSQSRSVYQMIWQTRREVSDACRRELENHYS